MEQTCEPHSYNGLPPDRCPQCLTSELIEEAERKEGAKQHWGIPKYSRRSGPKRTGDGRRANGGVRKR